MLIVDADIAYFGGMNIVDQTKTTTIAEAKAQRLPASAGWRDVHVRLEGPQQAEIATAFDELWKRHQSPRPRPRPWPVREMLAATNDSFFFFDSQPGLRFRSPLRVFLPLIDNAGRSITISMAYFLPVGKLLRALFRARRRGVEVQVIVPAQNDVRLVQWATRHLYIRLLRRGIRIFERQDQMLHSKATVIDGEWTIVGSCNLDPRSLWLNLEFLGVIRSRAMAEAIEKICAFEIENSQPVTLETYRSRRWWQCVLDRGAFMLRRWL